MGKEKYIKNIESLFDKSSVVNYSSIEKIIKNKKNVKQYVKRFIGNLIKKGKVKRLTKGFYTIHDNVSLIVFCFQPAYFGLQDALSFHNLWEQETIPVIVTSAKVRQGIRNVFGANILIRRINKKYLFGIQYYREDDIAIPYSDIEKTFIDMVYFREKMSRDVINIFKKKIDRKRLDLYLRNYPKRIKKLVYNLYE